MRDRPQLPRDYISLLDAADEIVRRRFGDSKEIPWVEAEPMLFQGPGGIEESRNVMELDKVLVTEARRQRVVASRGLRRAFAAGRGAPIRARNVALLPKSISARLIILSSLQLPPPHQLPSKSLDHLFCGRGYHQRGSGGTVIRV